MRLPRSENFWQAGASRAVSTVLGDVRGPRSRSSAARTSSPGDDTERFLEYWNHVFMTFELHEDDTLTELPQRGIDTGLGLEQIAVIQQVVDSVFDTDAFQPLLAPRRAALGTSTAA